MSLSEGIFSILTSGWTIVLLAVVIIVVAAVYTARREKRESDQVLSDVGADTGSLRIEPVPLEKKEPPPEEGKTRLIPLDEAMSSGAPPQPEGTVMIQWYGSLVGVSGTLEGKRLPIDSDKGYWIGRDKDLSEIVIDDSRVSRQHVWFGVEGDSVVAIDKGSTNGTMVNGDPIGKVALKPGDQIVISDDVTTLRYEP